MNSKKNTKSELNPHKNTRKKGAYSNVSNISKFKALVSSALLFPLLLAHFVINKVYFIIRRLFKPLFAKPFQFGRSCFKKVCSITSHEPFEKHLTNGYNGNINNCNDCNKHMPTMTCGFSKELETPITLVNEITETKLHSDTIISRTSRVKSNDDDTFHSSGPSRIPGVSDLYKDEKQDIDKYINLHDEPDYDLKPLQLRLRHKTMKEKLSRTSGENFPRVEESQRQFNGACPFQTFQKQFDLGENYSDVSAYTNTDDTADSAYIRSHFESPPPLHINSNAVEKFNAKSYKDTETLFASNPNKNHLLGKFRKMRLNTESKKQDPQKKVHLGCNEARYDAKRMELQNSHKPNPPKYIPDGFYKTQRNYKNVKDAIKRILSQPDYDDGSVGPIIVRLSFNCAATFDYETGTGGTNGATIRLPPESTDKQNVGLTEARKFLEVVKRKFPWLSYSDLYTLSSCVAIEEAGGPSIEWNPGRIDTYDLRRVPSNGRLPQVLESRDHIRDTFFRMGFNDCDIVTLMGAHCLGRCHTKWSGWHGQWTRNPTRFSNEYFKVLYNETWRAYDSTDTGKFQYFNEDRSLMMLSCDIVLIRDPVFKYWVQLYANDEAYFFQNFAITYGKLIELGVQREDV